MQKACADKVALAETTAKEELATTVDTLTAKLEELTKKFETLLQGEVQ